MTRRSHCSFAMFQNDPKGGKCITTKEDGVVEVEFGNAEEGAFMMEIYQGKGLLFC